MKSHKNTSLTVEIDLDRELNSARLHCAELKASAARLLISKFLKEIAKREIIDRSLADDLCYICESYLDTLTGDLGSGKDDYDEDHYSDYNFF